MISLHSPNLQQLLMQARYAPAQQRLLQLDACEALLHLIKPNGNYPFEFVCFHLTGYRRPLVAEKSPKHFSEEILSYETLIHDLPLYCLHLSQSLDIPIAKAEQPVFTMDSLATEFHVSAKTITRWRKRGLMGRYFLYPDGRRRLGILKSSVDFFLQNHQERVQRSQNFSRMSHEERTAILHRLTQWARRCPHLRQEAISRTAKKFCRSQETIRQLLLKLEKRELVDEAANSAAAFKKRAEALSEAEKQQLLTLFDQGVPISQLCRQFHRSKTNLYHTILLEKARHFHFLPIAFIDSEEFRRLPEEELLHGPAEMKPLPPLAAAGSFKSGVVMDSLESYAAEIAEIATLDARQETFLFRKYNYLKYQASSLCRRIDLVFPQARVIHKIRRALDEAERCKSAIIQYNLRLVVSIARKHTRREAEMLDLIGEGNLTLIKAIDTFDYSRGHKFSTYVTWAIIRRFASYRHAKQELPALPLYNDDDELIDVAYDQRRLDSRVESLEQTHRELDHAIAENLDAKEQIILREYYGLNRDSTSPAARMTFRQLGEVFGLSKERIRQIEKQALLKLRQVLSLQQFEQLLGA